MIKNINTVFNTILKNKKVFLTVVLISVFGIFIFGDIAHANAGDVLANLVTWLIHFLVWSLSHILTLLMYILVPIASYSNFVKSPPVIEAWHIVRDICNMFFILILLVIAFSVILRLEGYTIKKSLPKLLIMAVLINFSKTICGVFIDFSQVIMLTFVNSFKEVAGGNLTHMLGIADLLAFGFKEDQAKALNPTDVLGVYILALIYVLISIVVMCVIIGVLVMRIVMLWIYIVLSPIAYLFAAFPQGAKISSQWWSEFSKSLVVGPMLAFFIWLSFASLGTIDGNKVLSEAGKTEYDAFEHAPEGIPSKAGTAEHMIKFVISIGMLLGGLVVTQQVGGAFGGMAGKGMAAIQSGKGAVLGGAKGLALGSLDWVNRRQATATGQDLHVGRRMELVKKGLAEGKRKDLIGIQNTAQKNLAKGGVIGLATGSGAEGYMDGFRGLREPKKALAALFGHGKLTTQGISKKAVADKKINEKYSDQVFSTEEYDEQKTGLHDEYTNKMTTLSADFNAIEATGTSAEEIAEADGERATIKKEMDGLKDVYDGKHKKLDEKKEIAENTKDSSGRKMFVGTKIESKERKAEYNQKAEEATKDVAFYMDTNMDVVMQEKSNRAEEKNKIGEINDEDHIISLMGVAESQNDFTRFGALSEKLANVNGTNGYLAKEGYNTVSGFDDQEYASIMSDINSGDSTKKRQAEEKYDAGKGWNDLMREKGEKLGAQRQTVLRLQNDVGSIGENRGAIHLQKTVAVDASGQLTTTDRKTRSFVQKTENNKRNVEKVLRDMNRLQHGAEIDDGADYSFEPAGLAYISEHIDMVGKLFAENKINPSLIEAFGKETAQKQLREALTHLGKNEITGGKGEIFTIDSLLSKIKNTAEQGKDENFDAIVNIVEGDS